MQSTQCCCSGTAALPHLGMQIPHQHVGCARFEGLTCAQHRAGGKTAQAAPGSSSAGLSTSVHAWKSKPHPFHHCCTCGAGWLCGTHTEQSSLLSSQRCALCPWEGSRCADASSNIGNQSTGFHLPQVNPVLFTGRLLHFIFFFPS